MDDDPTGTQALAGVPVLLRWTATTVRAEAAGGLVHLLTNSRALTAEGARDRVLAAVHAARSGEPSCRILLRGDSTLRGHLRPEYEAWAEGTGAGGAPLLLVPALPAAGRVTLGGVHYLTRDAERVPVHCTEYAADSEFGYSSSRLLDWAAERSAGLFPADAGTEVSLERLRDTGPAAVETALADLTASGRPAVCVVDAEQDEDLELVAEGLRRAWLRGADVAVRCSPAFVPAVAQMAPADPVVIDPVRRILVVCGSYLPVATRQLARVGEAYPMAMLELDVEALVAGEDVVASAARAAGRLLDDSGLAVVFTPRMRPDGLRSLGVGERVARALAGVVAAVSPPPELLLIKGGVTSAVVVAEGLGAARAVVDGPLLPGVALWRVEGSTGEMMCGIVPGNVGGDDLLLEAIHLGQGKN